MEIISSSLTISAEKIKKYGGELVLHSSGNSSVCEVKHTEVRELTASLGDTYKQGIFLKTSP